MFKLCIICFNEFEGRKSAKMCGEECRKEAHNRRDRARWQARRRTPRPLPGRSRKPPTLSVWLEADTRVPAEPILSLVAAYVRAEEATAPQALEFIPSARGGGGNRTVAVPNLTARADVPLDTLEKFLNGRPQTLGFDMADRLLCAIGRPDAWRRPPLLDVYLAVNLAALDTEDAVQECLEAVAA